MIGPIDGFVDINSAIDVLMRFLAVEGVTGQEAAIGRTVAAALREAGVPKAAIRFDSANKRISLPTQTGNLVVSMPGTAPGPRLLFMAHLDTVPLAAGAVPRRQGNRIVAAGKTALGGDNRTGCAVLVNLIATLLKHKLPHPPLTFLFTVREESGLFGARYVGPGDLGKPVMGFNFDGRLAAEITIGAVGAERWQAEIFGKAAHAGMAPEKGISATAVGALAVVTAVRNSWFGKVAKSRAELANSLKIRPSEAENKRASIDDLVHGTSNVGVFGGHDGRSAGDATNVVTDYVKIHGESRSHDVRFARVITAAYREAFQAAATQVRDDAGRTAKVKFTARRDYYPFRLPETALVVRQARRAVESLGATPTLEVANGGLDANWLVKHRIPTVTLGAGQNAIHTVEEYVDLIEFAAGCRLAVALAVLGAGA